MLQRVILILSFRSIQEQALGKFFAEAQLACDENSDFEADMSDMDSGMDSGGDSSGLDEGNMIIIKA